MEAILPPAPAPSHAEALLSAELKVPQHDPGIVSSPQPRENYSPDDLKPSLDTISKVASLSAQQVTPADSAYSSLHNDDAQKAAAQVDLSTLTGILQREEHHEENPQRLDGPSSSEPLKQGESKKPTPQVRFEDDEIRVVTSEESNTGTSPKNIQENDGSARQTPEADQKSRNTPVPAEQHPTSQSVLPSETHAGPSSYNNTWDRQTGNTAAVPAPNSQIKDPPSKLLFWKRFRIPRSKNAAGKQPVVTTQAPQDPVLAVPNQHPSPPTTQSIHPSSLGSSNFISGTSHLNVERLDSTSVNASANTESNGANIFSETKDVPITSPDIYLEDGIYVGKLRELPPSTTADIAWTTTVRSRLITDLRPVLASLPRTLPRYQTTIELELCMAGRKKFGKTTVRLKPMIWVRCGGKSCKNAVRVALEDLSYLHAFPYHVSLDAPRVAASKHTPASLSRRAASTALSPGAIAGIVVGSVAGLLFMMVTAFYVWKRYRMKKYLDERPPEPSGNAFLMTEAPSPVYPGNYNTNHQTLAPFMQAQPMYPYYPPRRRQVSYSQPPQLYPSPITGWSPQPTLLSSPQPTIMESPQSTLINQSPPPKAPPSAMEISPYQDLIRPPSIAELYAPVAEESHSSVTVSPSPSSRGTRDFVGVAGLRTFPLGFRLTGVSTPQNSIAACGGPVRFTIRRGSFSYDVICTIGGVIRVQNDLYGLTTAHGMWENERDDSAHRRLSLSDPGYPFGEMLPVSVSSSNLGFNAISLEKLAYPVLYHLDKSRQESRAKEIEGADFALLRLRTTTEMNNSFKSSDSKTTILRATSVSPEPGPVSIVCSETDVRSGDLLRGSAIFMDWDGVWETKKIYCDPPLEVGTSGAWVVRDDTLLGIVRATYDKLPYIHMLPIDKVFGDIRSVVAGDGDPSEVDISLPGPSSQRATVM
ncbi:hypothetical protein DM02DRAFT_619097 [Periconia macrospinosa]|uniref:Uncharacterized protein n=1 Tax=Periconia macrospinosa TaxID=97972 RepID=A0A2V1D848_9PLEO|nr:hypothetical protein DM02DRAFT_619097 [Periconia macrospinosa]